MTLEEFKGLVVSTAPGGEIVLPDDADFPLLIRGRMTPLTVSGGGILPSVNVLQCGEDIRLNGLHVRFQPVETSTIAATVIKVSDTESCIVDGCTMESSGAVGGVPPGTPTDDPSYGGIVQGEPLGRGIYSYRVKKLVVRDCEIFNVHKGIALADTFLAIIRENEVRNIRTTSLSGSAPRLVAERNYFHDAKPYRTGSKRDDHADFIHMWTGTASKPGIPCEDYLIRGNLLDQGKSYPLMAIYLDDNGTRVGFPNVTVTDNDILTDHGQAMLIEQPDGGRITGNQLLQVTAAEDLNPHGPSLALKRDGLTIHAQPGLEVSGNRGCNLYRSFDAQPNIILPVQPRAPGELEAARYAWLRARRARQSALEDVA